MSKKTTKTKKSELASSLDNLIEVIEYAAPSNDADPGLASSLKKLLKEVEAPMVEGPALRVTDLTYPYSHLFTEASEKALSIRKKDLKPRRNIYGGTPSAGTVGTVTDEVVFFSAVAKGKKNLLKAAKLVMRSVNALSDKGYVTGALAPLSFLALHNMPHEIETMSVFCFPAVTQEGLEFIKENPKLFSVNTPEGVLGPTVS